MKAAGALAGHRRWQLGDDPRRVAEALDRGAVLAIPTESTYGLAVDPRDAAGVARIFRLKGRAEDKPLPIVGATVASFTALGVDPREPALRWASTFWPAALSVVVVIPEPIPASVGRRSLAVRVPEHEGLRDLLAALGRPLTATSANPSGAPPYLDPESLAAWLERTGGRHEIESLLVDGGTLPGGPPSTLVELIDGGPRVLREGRFHVG